MRTTTWHIDDVDPTASANPGQGQASGSMQSSASSTDGSSSATGGADSTDGSTSPIVAEKNEEGRQLLSQAAKRVWEELYVTKRQVRPNLHQEFETISFRLVIVLDIL